MHKSSGHSNKGCVGNEDAPTVISCAPFLDKRGLWTSSPQALFVFRRPLPGRKGMQNEKVSETTNHLHLLALE
jgi:hypothetical protein